MQTKEVEIEDDILCNKCGLSCNDLEHHAGIIEYKLVCGFGSILGDGNIFRFSLCEKCIHDMFQTFKIPAKYTICSWAASEDEIDIIEPETTDIWKYRF